MCSPAAARELGIPFNIPTMAVCACGAQFHDCEDDKIDAALHITERSSPSHQWVYWKYSFPHTEVEVMCVVDQALELNLIWELQQARRITQWCVVPDSTKNWYIKDKLNALLARNNSD